MYKMKWCPKCHRVDVEYDSRIGHERCLWRDCFYINKEDVDLDKAFDAYIKTHGTSFKKFAKGLKRKTSFLE